MQLLISCLQHFVLQCLLTFKEGKKRQNITSFYVLTNVFFLYPLKTSEKLWFSGTVERAYWPEIG